MNNYIKTFITMSTINIVGLFLLIQYNTNICAYYTLERHNIITVDVF